MRGQTFYKANMATAPTSARPPKVARGAAAPVNGVIGLMEAEVEVVEDQLVPQEVPNEELEPVTAAGGGVVWAGALLGPAPPRTVTVLVVPETVMVLQQTTDQNRDLQRQNQRRSRHKNSLLSRSTTDWERRSRCLAFLQTR